MEEKLGLNDKQFVLAEYKKLKQATQNSIQASDGKLLKSAFTIALAENGRQTYLNNEFYFAHAVNVAVIVSSDMGMGLTSVISALLSGVSPDAEALIKLLGNKRLAACTPILKDLNRISNLPTEKLPQNAENFASLILSLSSDVRVVLIKLADRLQYMRSIQSLDKQTQISIANETADLYAPLAHKLGLYRIKSELDELSLNYSKPDVYKKLSLKIEEVEFTSRNYVNQFIAPLMTELSRLNLHFKIKNRIKSVSSVYSKLQKQKIEFDEVYDLFAIRIIIDTDLKSEKADCWKAYSVVTNLYKPETSRMRDWITIPRPNGYESLHITVLGPSNKWIEVQIRSKRMDEEAEMGNAAHWRYKSQKGGAENSEWLNSIRKILENPVSGEEELNLKDKANIAENMIYVFTPDGDLKKLRIGSSVLDFAFEVHTTVGSKCSGARVNGKIVPLRTTLKSGDMVEVITSKKQNPNIDWLEWVISSRAKNKIKRFLKEAEFKQAETGKDILKRKVSQIKNVSQDEAINKLVAHFKLSGPLDLFQRLADSRIEATQIKDIITSAPKEAEVKPEKPKSNISGQGSLNKTSDNIILVNESSEIEGYKLARCCNPVMGDEIFGFVTVSDGIKIHRISCPNAARMRGRYPYRSMDAKWSTQVEGSFFIATVKISGFDQLGILNTITNMISQELRMDVRGISLDSKGGKFDGIVKVSIRDKKHLEFLIKKLLEIKGIIKASRLSTTS
ncbi:MAG: HD domain-containing protein [Lentimicrobium sp.]|jgi:GTP pyrophosphokinase|nr:HD domain-containing protein [Lentimicrobium sp.]